MNHKSLSAVSLVVFNLIPLAGIFFYGWDTFNILFLYWLESAVIGFYTILKIIKVMNILSIIIVPFFIVHFGGFMYGHLFFLTGILSDNYNTSLLEIIKTNLYIVWPAVTMLFVSHGVSFVTNFIGKKEYLNYSSGSANITKGSKNVMLGPYNRIILMHVSIIFGGWLMIFFKSSVSVLVLLVFAKIWFDLRAHLDERTPELV